MATQEQKNASDLGEQAIALAEQLGRIAGTIEGTAESWLNRQKLAEQLTRVRDGATQMLDGLSAGAERGRKAASAVVSRVRSKPVGNKKKAKNAKPAAAASAQDRAHAPGKRRRGPSPSTPGLKKSDETIPKARLAEANRQRRKSYA
jgi:hypothetical protein